MGQGLASWSSSWATPGSATPGSANPSSATPWALPPLPGGTTGLCWCWWWCWWWVVTSQPYLRRGKSKNPLVPPQAEPTQCPRNSRSPWGEGSP